MKTLNLTSWASDVIESLQKLGGQGTATEISSIVKTLTQHNRNTNDWKSSVLNVLNDYCSTKVDYKRIKTRKPDHPALFIDLGNKGSESLWGLNSSIVSDSELQTGSVNNNTNKITTPMVAKAVPNTEGCVTISQQILPY